MGPLQLAVLVSLFIAVVTLSMWGAQRLQGVIQVRRRLQSGSLQASDRGGSPSIVKKQGVTNPILTWVQSATATEGDQERRQVAVALQQMGVNSPSAPIWFVIVRFGLAIGLPLLFLFSQSISDKPATGLPLIFGALALCGLGFIAPRAAVDRLAANRKAALENQFPDALDLMVVCVEAGLGLESAFVRVGKEVTESHPRIAQEFAIVSEELRAGQTRADALRHLGERTDVPALRSFAALLIQTDALGTSIAQTLRTYSQEMRTHRYLRAEEKALRIPVLMTIPLVGCILPVIITSLLLPAVIDVMRILVPALKGGG